MYANKITSFEEVMSLQSSNVGEEFNIEPSVEIK